MRSRLKTKKIDLQRLIPHVVYCSPLQRALRTALVAYPDLRVVVDPRLREVGTRTGMQSSELRAFIADTAPQRHAKVDTTKVRDAAWWGEEDEKLAHARVQRVLREIYKKTSKGKVVAMVAHGGIFKTMIGKSRPFPKIWGSVRGFPRNFKPYYGTLENETDRLKVAPATADTASVVLLRHAHTRVQAANTLLQKIAKYRSSANKSVEAAAALDARIKRFKAERG